MKYLDLDGLKHLKTKMDDLYLSTNNATKIRDKINLTTETKLSLAAKYALLSNNSVVFYVIADSSGKLPSSETRVNVNSDITSLVGAEGANVGDMFIIGKLNSLPVYKIIPLNDAKADTSDFKGTNGVMTPWDKARVNKVDNIETTANNAANNLPTYGESNMNNALETGVYPWCTLGRPSGADGAFTCITKKSTTKDSNGYWTIEQTAYGREAEKGQVYKRVIFKQDDKDGEYTDWVELANLVNYSVNQFGGVTITTNMYPTPNNKVILKAGIFQESENGHLKNYGILNIDHIYGLESTVKSDTSVWNTNGGTIDLSDYSKTVKYVTKKQKKVPYKIVCRKSIRLGATAENGNLVKYFSHRPSIVLVADATYQIFVNDKVRECEDINPINIEASINKKDANTFLFTISDEHIASGAVTFKAENVPELFWIDKIEYKDDITKIYIKSQRAIGLTACTDSSYLQICNGKVVAKTVYNTLSSVGVSKYEGEEINNRDYSFYQRKRSLIKCFKEGKWNTMFNDENKRIYKPKMQKVKRLNGGVGYVKRYYKGVVVGKVSFYASSCKKGKKVALVLKEK